MYSEAPVRSVLSPHGRPPHQSSMSSKVFMIWEEDPTLKEGWSREDEAGIKSGSFGWTWQANTSNFFTNFFITVCGKEWLVWTMNWMFDVIRTGYQNQPLSIQAVSIIFRAAARTFVDKSGQRMLIFVLATSPQLLTAANLVQRNMSKKLPDAVEPYELTFFVVRGYIYLALAGLFKSSLALIRCVYKGARADGSSFCLRIWPALFLSNRH